MCLGIATLLYAAIAGAMWVVDQGFMPAATIFITIGGLSFVLYWIGFAWSRHTLLQNGAVLMHSLLIVGGTAVGVCLAQPSDRAC